MRVYCMFDTISEEAGPLFEAQNDAIARRIMSSLPKDSFPPGSSVDDFKLFKLGSYFRGDDKLKPCLHALEKAYDVTKPELKFGEDEFDEAV